MTNLPKSASPSEPRALIRKAAEELVAANADHGRTYDNSPDVDETARIISKWLIGAEPRRDERELAEKLFGRITFVSEGYRSRLDSAKTISEFEKILASRASAALPQTAQIPEPLMQDLVIHVIEKFTGPTGGWLESPAAVCNELCDALKNWAVPQPSVGQTEGK